MTRPRAAWERIFAGRPESAWDQIGERLFWAGTVLAVVFVIAVKQGWRL